MIGTPGFVGERLAQARIARGMTAVALADLLEVSSSNITLYESGRQTPSPEAMERIVARLNMPRDFFMKKTPNLDKDGINYRSVSAATKAARMRAEIRYAWLREIVTYLRKYLDFPKVNLPDFNVPSDPRQIDPATVEEMAIQCRAFYKLGDGPLPDLVPILEKSGVIISRGELGAETLDAFSQTPKDDEHPFIFLGSDKGSAVRSRFDCAHELGHILLHRGVNPSTARGLHVYSIMEKQCHHFAAALLLPESGFSREMYAPTLDSFAALKPRWRVAIAAMLKRTEDLGIITEDQAKRMWINLSRRGWRKEEPLDRQMIAEQPRLLRRSFELLLESGVKTKAQIPQDLCFATPEIERLACLPVGFLSDEPQAAEPRLKLVSEAPAVIPFRRKGGWPNG
jgi:Zn-dependent peptidase ImmA (M78 family)/transcriptional regulator with XRE-family HTH domain